ncbi:MAG: hypothetical protein K9G13_02240 [Aquiluna sp.]|nr:hypothetical protein [Aquiluna sp.]MCF8545344.1 hypothetical protein [Aquiluna sp.]
MKKTILVISSVLGLGMLTGCSTEIATAAADSAACRALESTLTGLSEAYAAGLVDSGVVTRVDELIGDSVRGLLSTSFASDLRELGEGLKSTDPAVAASDQVDSLLESVRVRCADVGVVFAGN